MSKIDKRYRKLPNSREHLEPQENFDVESSGENIRIKLKERK